MNKLLLAACAAFALTGASAAHAATFVTWSAPMPDGSITATYGDTGIGAGDFNDIFDLTLPTGTASFTLSSTFSSDATQDVNFTTVTFNSDAFGIGSTGQNEFRFLNGENVTLGGSQHLVVSGNSAGNGSYAGVITFAPLASVPEPAAWGLMILGFGGMGGILRRRNRSVRAAFA